MTVRIVAHEGVPEDAVLRVIQRLHGHTHPRREGGYEKQSPAGKATVALPMRGFYAPFTNR